MIRRGRDRYLQDQQLATVKLGQLIPRLTLEPGETMSDLKRRLDPERIANVLGITADGQYDSDTVPAYGEKLLSNGTIGVDMLVVPPGAGFPVHVHAGHHLLLCISGPGTFSLAGQVHTVDVGDLSMIEGNVPHAVGNPNAQPHVLLAIGCPPRELDAEDRMTVTDWDGEPVLVEAGHQHDHTHGLVTLNYDEGPAQPGPYSPHQPGEPAIPGQTTIDEHLPA